MVFCRSTIFVYGGIISENAKTMLLFYQYYLCKYFIIVKIWVVSGKYPVYI